MKCLNAKRKITLLVTIGFMSSLIVLTGVMNSTAASEYHVNRAEDIFVDQHLHCGLFSEDLITDTIYLTSSAERTNSAINVTIMISNNRTLVEDLYYSIYDWDSLNGEIRLGVYFVDGDHFHINDYNHPSTHPYYDLAYHYSYLQDQYNQKSYEFDLSGIVDQGWVYSFVIVKLRDYKGLLYQSAIGKFLYCEDASEHIESRNLLQFDSIEASYGKPINVSYLHNDEISIEPSLTSIKAELYIGNDLEGIYLLDEYNISSETGVTFTFDNIDREINSPAHVLLYLFEEDSVYVLNLGEFNLSIYQDRAYLLYITGIAIFVAILAFVTMKVHSAKTTRILLKTFLQKSSSPSAQVYMTLAEDPTLDGIFGSGYTQSAYPFLRIKILENILQSKNGLTRQQLSELLHNKFTHAVLNDAIEFLLGKGLIIQSQEVNRFNFKEGKANTLGNLFNKLLSADLKPSEVLSHSRMLILHEILRKENITRAELIERLPKKYYRTLHNDIGSVISMNIITPYPYFIVDNYKKEFVAFFDTWFPHQDDTEIESESKQLKESRKSKKTSVVDSNQINQTTEVKI